MSLRERIELANSRRRRDRAYYKKQLKEYTAASIAERRKDERAALEKKAKVRAAAKYGRSTTQKVKNVASSAISTAKKIQAATKSTQRPKSRPKSQGKRAKSTPASHYVIINGRAYKKGAPQKRRKSTKRKAPSKKAHSDPLSYKFKPFRL